MIGTIVNTAAIVAGGTVGLLLTRVNKERYQTTVMQAIGLSVIFIGIHTALKATDLLGVIICMSVGSLLGEFLDIELRIEALASWTEKRLDRTDKSSFSKGFVTASLIFCVGSMAIVGSLESGLVGNHTTLFAKSLLDGITSIVFAATFGGGVILSAIPVLIYQGTITMGASLLKPFLGANVIAQMSGVGGLLIAAIGCNILKLTHIKVGNMLPAVFLPIAYFVVLQLF
ncbi:conserved uncharacterized protein, DUF554 [Desulfosarcina variabilis str. Montpellier]|uniref:DUF554 domain-containing protein n=1 Tax=Desulfosarcina variabilis TaxID=2300 RepID=UPI003AFB3B0C